MLLRPVLLLAALLAGWAVSGWAVAAVDVAVVEPVWRHRVVVVLTAGAAAAGAALALLARRRPGLAADAAVVTSGVLLGAAGTAGLHGTRWGWYGLYADSSFRTQMATRYAETPSLVDYGYRDLPAYYPPALGWLEGRLAAVTDLAGWEAVKPVQLLVGVLVPLLADLLRRQVVGGLPAAAVAGLVTIWTAHPQKPGEWLVLTCLLPWWLLAVRDVRAPGVARSPAWRLGVVLGVLLLFHTYWFLPFGVATLLALTYDGLLARWRDRRVRLPLRRALAIGAVGLAVSAVSWVPVVVTRLRLPSDQLQLRYSRPEGNVPQLPSLLDPSEFAGLLGVAWLVWAGVRRLRRREAGGREVELPGGLALALAGCLATLGLGALAERAGIGLLAFKTRDAVLAVLLAAGVLGAADRLRRGRERHEGGHRVGARWAARLAPVALVGCVAASAGYHFADRWVTGSPALVAQTTQYPDGSVPTGDPAQEPYRPTLFVRPDDPPVVAVQEAWRRLRPDEPIAGAVLVTSRVDLLATTPVHGFLAYKSIYSHPNGRFEERRALLEEVAACDTSACAAALLRDNDLDRVDGLVLQRDGDTLVLPFTVDDFPDRTRRAEVGFPDRVLAGPEFLRTELGGTVVIALRP